MSELVSTKLGGYLTKLVIVNVISSVFYKLIFLLNTLFSIILFIHWGCSLFFLYLLQNLNEDSQFPPHNLG